jgi:hypothetical protein
MGAVNVQVHVRALPLSFPLAAKYDLSDFNVLHLKIFLRLKFCSTNLVYIENLILFFIKATGKEQPKI